LKIMLKKVTKYSPEVSRKGYQKRGKTSLDRQEILQPFPRNGKATPKQRRVTGAQKKKKKKDEKKEK